MHLRSIDAYLRSIHRFFSASDTGAVFNNIEDFPRRSIDQWADRTSFHSLTHSQNSPSFFQMNEPSIDRHHLQSVYGFVGHFYTWFFTAFCISILDNFFAKQRQNILKLLQKCSRHTPILGKKHWKLCEIKVHQYPLLKFVVCPQATHYDSTQHFVHMYFFKLSQSHGYQSQLSRCFSACFFS